jgi:transposase
LTDKLHLKKMSPCRTEMSPQDKGKILAYMENFNATQIAKKMGRDPTTIRRFIKKYKETGATENLPRSGRPLLSIIMKKMHLHMKLHKIDALLYMKLLIH